MTRTRRRFPALLAAAALAAGLLGACAADQDDGTTLTVLAPWGGTEPGTEGHAFRGVLAEFTARTGIAVDYQDARAVPQVLLANLQAGNPPDVAVLASPAELAGYARAGDLRPLDGLLDDEQRAAFRQQWLLPREVDGVEHIYTIPVKANLKGLIWFNPRQELPPEVDSWDTLLDASRTKDTPWCMGMGDAPSSGWPATDMIEDVFLRSYGPERYRQWAAGEVQWTALEVRTAWTTWGEIATSPQLVHGGPTTVLLTDFADAGRPMFTDPPGCLWEQQASFATGFYRGYRDVPGGAPEPGEDFDFFSVPASGAGGVDDPWIASADLAGMFDDTPEARRLMRFLATDAQRLWPDGGAFVVNTDVDPPRYGDQVSTRIAEIIRSADSLCFDAADLMPATMRNAYYQAVLEYLSYPARLDTLLAQLDTVRLAVPDDDWLDLPCGQRTE